eukprot:g5541.t1
MEPRDIVSKLDAKSGSFFKDVSPMLGSKMRERIALHDENRRIRSGPQSVTNPSISVESVSHQQLEQKVQQYMDAEDKRVSEVVEGILYDFLPAAFDAIIPSCIDPMTELNSDRCKLVASAALSVGALLNCPPEILEFLIRIPWQSIEELLKRKSNDHEWIAEQLEISQTTRLELLNTPIHPTLIPSVLQFVFTEPYLSSAPSQLCPDTLGDRQSHLEKVAAVLDGACTLHCAAMRGNPAQVCHFLSSGADPLQKTVIGDLAIELVPFCGDRSNKSHKKICRCMSDKEQEIWECRSNSSRTLIARHCILTARNGVIAWLMMLMLCILSWIGFWGCHENICGRPKVIKHVEDLKKAKSDKARFECNELINALRKQVQKGHQLLIIAKQQPCPLQKKGNSSEDNVTENAVMCFARAIQSLQSLEAKNEGKDSQSTNTGLSTSSSTLAEQIQFPECQLSVDEKANVYSSWAESVLYKFKFCRCAGCAALAVQAVRMAHVHCAQILEQIEKQKIKNHEKWNSVGRDLMKIIYFHICLLVETEAHRSTTDARRSATKASLWRAEQCLNEWRRLRSKGYLSSGGKGEEKEILELSEWVQTAESDLLLAEALYGDDLTPSQTIKEVLVATVTHSSSGLPYLVRPSALENLNSIELVLKSVKSPSPDLASLTQEVMENGKKEINADMKLKESLSSKTAAVALGSIKKLTQAIQEASVFPRLSELVSEARKQQQQLRKKAEAIEKLEEIMIQVKEPIPISNKRTVETYEESSILSRRIQSLEAGIDQGKQAKINIEKAKRLLKDLQNQMSAVGAAYQLDKLMGKKPCGSVALRNALSKAEGCYASASSTLTSGLLSMSEFLLPRIQSARKRLDVEKVVESLHRATSMYKSVQDLSKLESNILEARKLGAEELDPVAFNAARALRGKLDTAGKLKQQLDNGTKQVQKHHRESDVLALDEIIHRASGYCNLIKDDVQKAQEAVDQWRRIQEVEERLSEAMKSCRSSMELSKMIQEANGVGAKLQGSKRVLKLIQNLESGIKSMDQSLESCKNLQSILEEMEGHLVGQKLVHFGRQLLEGMLAVHACVPLDSVLKESEDTSNLTDYLKRLQQALEDSKVILRLPTEFDEKLSGDFVDVPWPVDVNKETLEENKRSLSNSILKVESRVLSCEAEIKKRLLEQEVAEQTELQNQANQKSEALISEDSKNCKAITSSSSSLNKMTSTSDATTAQWRPFSSVRSPILESTLTLHEKDNSAAFAIHELESHAAVEHGIRTLLEHDSPQYSTGGLSSPLLHESPLDVNLHARDILETLNDPWGVEESTNDPSAVVPPLPPSPYTNQTTTMRRCNLQDIFPLCQNLHPSASREITSLFEKGMMRSDHGINNAVNCSRMESFQLQNTRTQQLTPMMLKLNEGIRGTSAFSTGRPSIDNYPEVPPMLPRQNLQDSMTGQSAAYPKTCPFPGVGIAIPGELNRSLSDKISRNNSADQRHLYSQSTELRRGLTFDSTNQTTTIKKPFG